MISPVTPIHGGYYKPHTSAKWILLASDKYINLYTQWILLASHQYTNHLTQWIFLASHQYTNHLTQWIFLSSHKYSKRSFLPLPCFLNQPTTCRKLPYHITASCCPVELSNKTSFINVIAEYLMKPWTFWANSFPCFYFPAVSDSLVICAFFRSKHLHGSVMRKALTVVGLADCITRFQGFADV